MSTTNPIRLAEPESKAMPRRVSFTAPFLERLKCPAGRDRTYVYDARMPGLAVLVTETGAKSFYVVKKVNGQTKRYRLGGFPETSVEQARKLAAKIAQEVNDGIDPLEKKRRAKAERTLANAFAEYMAKHAKLHKKTWEEDQEQWDNHSGALAHRCLSTIREEDIRGLHARMGAEHPYAANRMLAMLSKVFNFAHVENPCKGVQRFREKSRDRFLQADELPRFFKALDAEPNETIRDFVYLALWTGARRSNVQEMRWDELNLEAATWRIPETKTGDPLVVHLAAPAVEILRRRLAERADRDCPYVLPGRSGGTTHMSEPKAAWANLLKRAGISNLRVHDLRRTLGSYQAAGGSSLQVIGKSLGHKNVSTTAIYSRLNLDPVKQSVDAATAAMLKAGGKTPGKPGDPGDDLLSLGM